MRNWMRNKRLLRLGVLSALSIGMWVRGETPETLMTPQNREIKDFSFDVRFARVASSEQLWWIVIHVSDGEKGRSPKTLYFEIWNQGGLLSATEIPSSRGELIPDALLRETDGGKHFLLKLSQCVMERSWGAILLGRRGRRHSCVIRLRDWFRESSPILDKKQEEMHD